MAITSVEDQCNDTNNLKICQKAGSCCTCVISSATSRKSKPKNSTSPYLNADKVKLHSIVTEKKLVHKKATDFMSSFPLAVNIYKANSDEFKFSKKIPKKSKKCVHTLPNDATSPQVCTVSDMNDSEYNDTKNYRKPKPKVKKRTKNNKPIPDRSMKIFDRDAKYCSQLNINLDSSSTDMFKHLTGDCRKVEKKAKNMYGRNQMIDNNVWAVLRNLNQIQFIPSPPMSVNSVESMNKKKSTKRRSSDRTDTSYIETCHTEEIAYISYDSTSMNSQSRSSSFDRITVIGKHEDDEVKILNNVEPIKEIRSVAKQKIKSNSRFKSNKKLSIKDKQESKDKKYSNYEANPKESCVVRKNDGLFSNNNKTYNTFNEENVKVSLEDNLKTEDKLVFRDGCESLTSLSENQKQVNGITKVVLNKGKEADTTQSKPLAIVRKPRLSTTMPSSGLTRLTQTDIRRRLTNIKFPIIITEKDQVSSIPVLDYDPPQFYGLDKQIWPFMVDWVSDGREKNVKNNNSTQDNIEAKKQSAPTVTQSNPKPSGNKDVSCKKTNEIPPMLKVNNNYISIIDLKAVKNKEKPIRQFKERIFNFVNNRSPGVDNKFKPMSEVPRNQVSIETQTNLSKPQFRRDRFVSTPIGKDMKVDQKGKTKYPWSKAKWASDFIENVIKKVKSGVYYGVDNQRPLPSIESDNKFTQTDAWNVIIDKFKKETLTGNHDITFVLDNDHNKVNEVGGNAIPGFEESIPGLELETVSRDRIAVKHCNTNIVVHFDIAFPYETKKSIQENLCPSLLPVTVTENRIYKYEATITNAILPAELCSIFPKMLCNIFDAKTFPIFPQPINTIDNSSLFPIKEISQYESLDVPLKLPHEIASPLAKLQLGSFSNALHRHQIFKPVLMTDTNLSEAASQFMPVDTKLLFSPAIPAVKHFKNHSDLRELQAMGNKVIKAFENPIVNICTAVVPYNAKQHALVKWVPKTDLFITPRNVPQYNFPFVQQLGFACPYNLKRFGNKTVIYLFNKSYNEISFTINQCKIDLFYKNSVKEGPSIDEHGFNFEKEDTNELKRNVNKVKPHLRHLTRSRGHSKLCKKCKSTSSLSHYKKSTPLQKIANLDEFFQALGSAKVLAGVIDGDTEKKILSYIVEMKLWLTELTPTQALLILLFANKKDTSNTIRFRNVILQGIAMNRITKASELDLELEVIEKEKLNTSQQFEGIYLPATVESEDNLLEELCWIAKTTASDYQKTFDKSSEKLLKSLLGKRKKLNPSYLRVMARYVGLGLLKSK